jgi:hypothetical protein
MKTNIKSRQINGTWYAPEVWLSEHRGVVMSGYYDQSSSAGDWSGYFVQKFGNKYGLFLFSQENQWPNKNGFWLEIQERAIGVANQKLTRAEVLDFLNDYMEDFI